jgi:hypothetical protein
MPARRQAIPATRRDAFGQILPNMLVVESCACAQIGRREIEFDFEHLKDYGGESIHIQPRAQ